MISGGRLGIGREVTHEGRGEGVAWGTKGTHSWVTEATHEWVVGGSYEWGAFLRRGGEGAGREGKAERGQEEGMRAETTKGRHLPGRKGRPFGEGGEANYS